MAPRIVIIGGGSFQWVPKLLVDVANTPSLHDSEIVLCDIDPDPLPRMVELVQHVAEIRGIRLTAIATTEQRAALDGADYVVVSISTGGFESMRHDLEIPARFGIRQSVGDTVGPGGIVRALRNGPVLVEIARDMQERCPGAWLLNLTNPMTALCRAVTKATAVRTVGLCHEVTIAQFVLSLLLDESFLSIRPTVAGVNHLPLITALDVDGADGLARLRDLLDDAGRAGAEPLAMPFPEGLGHEKISEGPDWTKGDLLSANRVKLELFERFGVLPGVGDRHLVEFFSGFLTEEADWGARWGVQLTSIDDRESWQQRHIDDFEGMLAASEVSELLSGEMVAGVIDSLMTGRKRRLPLNIPNSGQVADLPSDVVTESICVADGDGVRGGDPVSAPPALAEALHRVSSSQELTVEAGLTGDRDKVFAAMFLDPLASRIDFDQLAAMTNEMLAATKPWLPQFA
ncbi:MAG: hypothetical protein ACRDWD_10915 [Acidimicrobiia bacterium]